MSKNVHTVLLPNGHTNTRTSATRRYGVALLAVDTIQSAAWEVAHRQEQVATWTARLDSGYGSWGVSTIQDKVDRESARLQAALAVQAALEAGEWSGCVVSWHANAGNAQRAIRSHGKHEHFRLLAWEIVELDQDLQADLTPAQEEAPKAPRSSWATRLQAVLTGEEVITLSAAAMATLGWPASAAKHRAYWGANPAGKAARAAGYTPSLRKVDGALALVLTRQG